MGKTAKLQADITPPWTCHAGHCRLHSWRYPLAPQMVSASSVHTAVQDHNICNSRSGSITFVMQQLSPECCGTLASCCYRKLSFLDSCTCCTACILRLLMCMSATICHKACSASRLSTQLSAQSCSSKDNHGRTAKIK